MADSEARIGEQTPGEYDEKPSPDSEVHEPQRRKIEQAEAVLALEPRDGLKLRVRDEGIVEIRDDDVRARSEHGARTAENRKEAQRNEQLRRCDLETPTERQDDRHHHHDDRRVVHERARDGHDEEKQE